MFRVDSSGWTRLGVDDAGFLDLVPAVEDGGDVAELIDEGAHRLESGDGGGEGGVDDGGDIPR